MQRSQKMSPVCSGELIVRRASPHSCLYIASTLASSRVFVLCSKMLITRGREIALSPQRSETLTFTSLLQHAACCWMLAAAAAAAAAAAVAAA